jgi:hypothetical protein
MVNILKNIFLVMCFVVCSKHIHGQSNEINRDAWEKLRTSAQKIGFCVYHIQQEIGTEQNDLTSKIEKLKTEENDIEYFKLDSVWANQRIRNWAKKQSSKPNENIILFDIDQGYLKQLDDTVRTSNSFKMFSILNLKHQYSFKIRQRSELESVLYITPNKRQSILSNVLWREFMSNRLGRFDSEIVIKVNGKNAHNDLIAFQDAFRFFLEKWQH